MVATTKGSNVIRMASALMDRLKLSIMAGRRFDDKRDFYEVFGYLTNVRVDDMLAKYARQDIASRIVDAPPEATWSLVPEMDKAPPRLAKQWEDLSKKFPVWTILQRADRLSRLGRFSTIMLGLNDGANPGSPATTGRDIIYLKAFGEDSIDIESFIADPTNPRFGKPEMYRIREPDDPSRKSLRKGKLTATPLNDILVHHSRMLHIVENPLEDDTFSTPIMFRIFNILDDLLKVVGGSSETFWMTANRGLHADVDKEMDIDEDDAAELADEIEEYQHQLRRVIRTRGVTLNSLGSDTPSPKDNFDILISVLSGATGIPKRILIGSEAGQLASSQDKANWAERIEDRRRLFAEPYVLNPFIRLLQERSILNEGDFKWKWPDAYRESPLERAQTMAAKARAVGNLSRQTGNKAPMQITTREESREIIGFEDDLTDEEVYALDPLRSDAPTAAELTSPAPAGGAPQGGGGGGGGNVETLPTAASRKS